MAIPTDKERLILTLPKDLKATFLEICKKEKRTPSKQVEFILEKYIFEYNK